jgi:hypothetical protein
VNAGGVDLAGPEPDDDERGEQGQRGEPGRRPWRYLVTAPTLSEIGPCRREQVLNGNGISLDRV